MGTALVFALGVSFSSIECYKCHVHFAVPEDFDRKRHEDKQSFWCPNGHEQHYVGKSAEQKLREELEATKAKALRDLEFERKRVEWARQDAKKQAHRTRAYKAVASRIKNRVRNGVCPVKGCRRHFSNLQQHIETKHQQYRKEVKRG